MVFLLILDISDDDIAILLVSLHFLRLLGFPMTLDLHALWNHHLHVVYGSLSFLDGFWCDFVLSLFGLIFFEVGH